MKRPEGTMDARSMIPSKVAVAGGLVLMLITGYQAMIYREDLRLTQKEFVGLPLPLLLQLLASAALCLIGGLGVSGEFKPVALADNIRPVIYKPLRMDFATFSHRGRAFAALPQLQGIPAVPSIG